MRASIFTSKNKRWLGLLGLVVFLILPLHHAHAQSAKPDRTTQPEEEDYSNTPYTEYGEFNTDKDEEEDTRFFQNGRFFGISLGLGFEGATGNRGALYSGGFPYIDVKVHYWFDFNFALTLGFSSVNFNYLDTSNVSHSVNIINVGVDLRYYFDVRNVTAAISFANPYLLVGGGSYTKNDTGASSGVPVSDSSFGFDAGAGLEFALKPKKVYFQLEGKLDIVNYQDTQQPTGGLPNLTGVFYSMSGNFLFTW